MNFKSLHRYRWLIPLCGILFALDLLTFLWAERQWFAEVGYLSVFWTKLRTQGLLGVIITSVSLAFLGGNWAIARQQAWSVQLPETDRPQLPGKMGLTGLLPLTLLLSLGMGGFWVYQGLWVVAQWQNTIGLPQAPPPLGQMMQVWQWAIAGGVAIAILWAPQLILGAIAVCISLGFGFLWATHWTELLAALSPTLFQQADPLFGQDISLYVFNFPVWEGLQAWGMALSVMALLSVSLIYLLSGDSFSQGNFPGFTTHQKRHLYGLAALLFGMIAAANWLNRYRLLYKPDGVVFGAGYTNVTIQLPGYELLTGLAILLAVVLAGVAAVQRVVPPSPKPLPQRIRQVKPDRPPELWKMALPLWGIVLFVIITGFVEWFLPAIVQRTMVQPNELQREQPYIKHAIAATRDAFGLNDIEVETFDPENSLTFADLQNNSATVENIRLWDTRPLLETNRQLQRIRLYYEFPDADIDRYKLPTDPKSNPNTPQQVLIAARELDYDAVPAAAKTWVNQHLIYTHGYGFTLSPVNTAGEGGLPDYLVQGIEPITIDPRVKDYIPIGKPRIYYGELTNNYVMTQTQVRELDYPSGSENVYNTYDGAGGIDIGGFFSRLIMGKHLRDWRMLLTRDFTPQTRVLFRRNINQRVRAIAPFLRYDSDPYLVVADTQGKEWQNHGQNSKTQRPSSQLQDGSQPQDDSYLYWMIDAYTTSNRYPYSDPLNHSLNYIRNSVKVVIDAYHGSVNFYVADDQDPLIKTWQRVFPNLFQPISQMPAALRQHTRYPQDLYQVQSEHLMTYHMTDPVVFYNREDQWRAPNEIYDAKQQLVRPYYLITKLPSGTREEFILLSPFTPAQRNNLISWLSARSDGDQYGKMLLYVFPKQRLIYGPEQIEARINQDPVISQRISLWNRQGSRAVQGNLLVIPIERSLLYVEPLYLEAEQNQLPTLVQVIVAYRDRIVMADTLKKALEAIFLPAPEAPTIIRPVETPEP